MPNSSPPARPHILVVDDDAAMRQGIRLILEKSYDIEEAATIAESIALFDRREPDLITLDINMPDVSGLEGLDYFRKKSHRIPIILISGVRSFELAREALRLGANDYLTKPFGVEELRQIVQSSLARVIHDEEAVASDDKNLRLPLESLREDGFLSVQHRSNFLAFAQNVLADKKRTFETITVHELVRTVLLQFRALHLPDSRYVIDSSCDPVRVECDMYLLGGALANLLLSLLRLEQHDPARLEMKLAKTADRLQVVYKKGDHVLPADLLARFEHWRQHPHSALDADTAMLVLAEKAVQLHHGELRLPAPGSGRLLEILLPLTRPIV